MTPPQQLEPELVGTDNVSRFKPGYRLDNGIKRPIGAADDYRQGVGLPYRLRVLPARTVNCFKACTRATPTGSHFRHPVAAKRHNRGYA